MSAMNGSDMAQLIDQVTTDTMVETVDDLYIDHSAGANEKKLLLSPATEEDICNILRLANEWKWTVTPLGNGSKLGMGGISSRADLYLSLKRMTGIVEFAAGDLTMTVRAGTTLREIDEYLREAGQFFPLDAPHPDRATIGGVVSANSSGPRRIRYGSARDHIIAMRVVYPNGKVIRTGARVVKNVAGYDMNKLFIGAMGTLGIITEVTFRLRPRPPLEKTLLIEAGDFGTLQKISSDILQSHLEPVTLEVCHPLNLLSKYKPDEHQRPGLVVTFADEAQAVDVQTQIVISMAWEQGCHVEVMEAGEADQWWRNFYSLPPTVEKDRFAFKAGLWLTDVIPFMSEACKQADDAGLSLSIHGGAGTGLVHLYFDDVKESKYPLLKEMFDRLRLWTDGKEGYVIVSHGTESFRQGGDVWGKVRPGVLSIMKGIKQQIDPEGILNNGIYVGGI